MKECIRLVRETSVALASGKARNQPRRRLALETGAVLHAMAGAWGNYFGTKVYSTHVKHGMHFHVVLYEAATGKPLALIGADYLGQIRTGAASGVATDLMARHDASTVGVIGSGFQAQTQVEAVMKVRTVKQVRVWSRSQEKRERFSQSVGAVGRAVGSAREAVQGADIVITATFARDPVLEVDWISDGTHVNAIGSNNSQRRELPMQLLDRASLIAVDSLEQALIESGDLLLAWPPETWPAKPLVELQEIAAGKPGRSSPSDVTIFKSHGLGVWDVAAAAWVYEQATAKGLGTAIRFEV